MKASIACQEGGYRFLLINIFALGEKKKSIHFSLPGLLFYHVQGAQFTRRAWTALPAHFKATEVKSFLSDVSPGRGQGRPIVPGIPQILDLSPPVLPTGLRLQVTYKPSLRPLLEPLLGSTAPGQYTMCDLV